jgi:hypothetical protein
MCATALTAKEARGYRAENRVGVTFHGHLPSAAGLLI